MHLNNKNTNSYKNTKSKKKRKTQIDYDKAVEEFLTDHRFFVEPACGATLAAIYSGYLEQITLQEGPIVPIVCGGNSVSLDMVQFWKDNAYS